MAFRFWRRIKIAPGVTLNLSKSGGSLSFGPRGAKFTVGSRGKRATVGIPGTGLFYTTTLPRGNSGGKRNASSVTPTAPSVRAEDLPTLGFFKRLLTPDDEEALVDSCRELESNDEISAHVCPDLRRVLLGLVEVYQRQERWQAAIACLERLRRLEPDDVVVKLSLAELLLDLSACDSQTGAHPSDLPAPRLRQAGKNVCQKVVRLVEGIENETPIHAALMLYKAKALRHLGLATAARDTLTAALRRKKDRSIAIAHGPEDLCEVEPPKSTKKTVGGRQRAGGRRRL